MNSVDEQPINKKLNNDYIQLSFPTRTTIIPIDMQVYSFLVDLHYKSPGACEALDRFEAISLTKSLKIVFSMYDTKLVQKYIEEEWYPLFRELFILWYTVGFGAIKLYYIEGRPFPIPKLIQPSDGTFMIIHDPDLPRDKIIFQWHDPLFQMDSCRVNKIMFDNTMVFFVPFKPKVKEENTMDFVDMINHFLLGCEELDICNLKSFLNWSTTFTSPWVNLLMAYFEHMRLSESQVRIEEQKINQKLYVENHVNFGNEQIGNYIKAYSGTETKGQMLNDIYVEKMLRGYPKSKQMSVDTRAFELPGNDAARLWEQYGPNNHNMNTRPRTRLNVEGTNPYENFGKAFASSNIDSNILNKPQYINGQRMIIGSPIQRFSWAPIPTERSEFVTLKQMFTNEVHEMYALANRVLQRNRTAKGGTEPQDRSKIMRTTKTITKHLSTFLVTILGLIAIKERDEYIKSVESIDSIDKDKKYDLHKELSNDFVLGDMDITVEFQLQIDIDPGELVNLLKLPNTPPSIELIFYQSLLDQAGIDKILTETDLVKTDGNKRKLDEKGSTDHNVKDPNKKKQKKKKQEKETKEKEPETTKK